MNSCFNCVLGQLFADNENIDEHDHGYGWGVDVLLREGVGTPRAFGFNLPDGYALDRNYERWHVVAWLALNDLWIKEIQR